MILFKNLVHYSKKQSFKLAVLETTSRCRGNAPTLRCRVPLSCFLLVYFERVHVSSFVLCTCNWHTFTPAVSSTTLVPFWLLTLLAFHAHLFQNTHTMPHEASPVPQLYTKKPARRTSRMLGFSEKSSEARSCRFSFATHTAS